MYRYATAHISTCHALQTLLKACGIAGGVRSAESDTTRASIAIKLLKKYSGHFWETADMSDTDVTHITVSINSLSAHFADDIVSDFWRYKQ